MSEFMLRQASEEIRRLKVEIAECDEVIEKVFSVSEEYIEENKKLQTENAELKKGYCKILEITERTYRDSQHEWLELECEIEGICEDFKTKTNEQN